MTRPAPTSRRSLGAPSASIAALLPALAAALPSADAAAQLVRMPEGRIRFYAIASSGLDPYTQAPTAAEAAWMREHYDRMQVWSPYFDKRLSWYPNGWVYKDLYGIKPSWSIASQHPEWILRDARGNELFIPFACSGGSCSQYAADVGNPKYVDYWIGRLRSHFSVGYPGVYVDDVNLTWRVSDGTGKHVTPIDPRTGKEMSLANWRRYFVEFLEKVRASFPQRMITHNAIWYALPLNDPYLDRAIAAADVICLERGINDNGLVYGTSRFGLETFFAFVDYVHAKGKSVLFLDGATTIQQREYGLAGWLLISDGRDLFCAENRAWMTPDRWWPGYSRDLGRALGPRYHWKGLLRRDFARGTVLLNQPGQPTITVQVTLGWHRVGDSPHPLDLLNSVRVTLPAKSAAILFD